MNRAQYLQQLIDRARLLQGASCERVTRAITAMKAGLSEENDARVTKLIREAQAGGKGCQAALQLAAMRIETVDNFVTATSNALTFIDTVDLAADEEPWIDTKTRQFIKVDYIGQDGRPKKTQASIENERTRVDLFTISTEEFEYYVFDIYKGDVRTPQLASVDMAYDLMMAIDGILWPYIEARILAPGAEFNFSTGPKSSRVLVPHSRINVKNLPKTNLLVPAGNTTTSHWRKACMDMVLRYVAAWGTNTFRDGPLIPVTVFLPSKDVMGFLDEIESFTEANPNSKVEEIMATGFVLIYGGVRWQFVGDVTLDPDKGRAFVKMNKGVGTFFTKKAGDKVIVDNSVEMQKNNKESVTMTHIIGSAFPSSKQLNIAAVQYKTAV